MLLEEKEKPQSSWAGNMYTRNQETKKSNSNTPSPDETRVNSVELALKPTQKTPRPPDSTDERPPQRGQVHSAERAKWWHSPPLDCEISSCSLEIDQQHTAREHQQVHTPTDPHERTHTHTHTHTHTRRGNTPFAGVLQTFLASMAHATEKFHADTEAEYQDETFGNTAHCIQEHGARNH
jgi:hypothetical protein